MRLSHAAMFIGEGSRVLLTAQSRRAQATPTPRVAFVGALRKTQELSVRGTLALGSALGHLFGERIPSTLASFFGPRGLRLILNAATACLVVSLPFAAASQMQTATASTVVDRAPVAAISNFADDAGARAQTQSRGLLAGTRSLVTVAAADVPEIPKYVVKKGDTLSDIAASYGVNTDDIAYANGFADDGINIGETLVIPPGRGALYIVKPGDTIASVASKFKVEQSAIMTYNRLYFEPEHFAPDQLIFVPGADVPAIKRLNYGTIGNVAPNQLPASTGRLAWPVNGVITQYFWWGHTGVDLAVPYGTTIGSSDDGVVVATGWVAVGGLRVCVQHAGGLMTCYYHTGAVFVSPGQTVVRGQPLASVGMTGVTTGPHVHWELRVNGVYVNPLLY